MPRLQMQCQHVFVLGGVVAQAAFELRQHAADKLLVPSQIIQSGEDVAAFHAAVTLLRGAFPQEP